MNQIKNNSTNILTILNDGVLLDTVVSVRFRQLGGSGYVDIPVLELVSDCYTYTFEIIVPMDYLYNGSYLVELVDAVDTVLYRATAEVSGFDTENPRAFIVSDTVADVTYYETVKPVISITFSDDGLTFSNN